MDPLEEYSNPLYLEATTNNFFPGHKDIVVGLMKSLSQIDHLGNNVIQNEVSCGRAGVIFKNEEGDILSHNVNLRTFRDSWITRYLQFPSQYSFLDDQNKLNVFSWTVRMFYIRRANSDFYSKSQTILDSNLMIYLERNSRSDPSTKVPYLITSPIYHKQASPESKIETGFEKFMWLYQLSPLNNRIDVSKLLYFNHDLNSLFQSLYRGVLALGFSVDVMKPLIQQWIIDDERLSKDLLSANHLPHEKVKRTEFIDPWMKYKEILTASSTLLSLLISSDNPILPLNRRNFIDIQSLEKDSLRKQGNTTDKLELEFSPDEEEIL